MKRIFDTPYIGITSFSDEIAVSGSSPGTTAVQSVRSKLADKQTELNIENISDILVF